MNLEQLTRRAIDLRRLDADALGKIRRRMDRASCLSADEYEALRSLGRALRSGEVEAATSAADVGHTL